jgi:hypothetical protein
MSSAPINPPSGPVIPPFWRNESDWIVLIEFLPHHDAEDRAEAAERIGYMLAYAQMTDTRMLARSEIPKQTLMNYSSPSIHRTTKLSFFVCSDPMKQPIAKMR